VSNGKIQRRREKIVDGVYRWLGVERQQRLNQGAMQMVDEET
jgi:hypothetical protein